MVFISSPGFQKALQGFNACFFWVRKACKGEGGRGREGQIFSRGFRVWLRNGLNGLKSFRWFSTVQENWFTRFEHVCKWFTKEFTNGSEKVQKM